jgi:predicted XRE-type DNA-binding protein
MSNKIKSNLVNIIKTTADERRLGQRDLARKFDLHQARVSNLLDERLYMFTIDELMKYVEALGFDVEVEVSPKEEVL